MAKKRDDFDENDFLRNENAEEVEPLDEDELEIVEPIDEDELDVVEPVDEEDLDIVEPIDEDDLEIVEPVGEDELEIVEPVDEDEMEVVEPIDEDELDIVEASAKVESPGLEPLDDVDEMDLEAAEETALNDLQAVDPEDDEQTELLDLPRGKKRDVVASDTEDDDLEVVEPVDEDGDSELATPPVPPQPPTVQPPAQPTKLAKKSPAPTKLAKKSPAPTKLAKKSPAPTKLSKKTPDPTMLAKGDLDSLEPSDEEGEGGTMPYTAVGKADKDGPSGQHPMNASDADFVVGDEGSGVLDQLIGEDLPEQDIAEVEQGPELSAEDEPDLSSMFDSDQQPSMADVDLSQDGIPDESKELDEDEESDDTVSYSPTSESDDFEDVEDVDIADFIGDDQRDDDASAVDLGGEPQPGSQLSGVDPIADGIESGKELGENGEQVDDLSEVDEISEVDAADILAEDDEPSPVNLDSTPVPSKKGDSQFVDVDEDDLADVDAVDLLDDEPMPAPTRKGKKKKKRAPEPEDLDEEFDDDFDDDEPAPRGRRGRTKKAPKPRRLRWMIVGMFFMTLLVAGGAAAVWYWKPDLIDEAIAAIPESPNMDPKAKALKKLKSGPEMEAIGHIDNGEYGDAISILQQETTPTAKSLRGHARLLKYLGDKKIANQPPVVTDSEVQTALKELEEGKQQLLAEQIRYAFNGAAWKAKADELTPGDATAKQIAKLLGAPLDQTPTQVGALMKRKAELENNNKEYVKTLKSVDKTVPDADLDPKKLESIVGSLAKSDADLKTINDLLEKAAKIQDDGSKGVQSLVKQKLALDKLLAAVDATLKTANLKESGPEGVKKLAKLQAELEKEKARLAAAVAAAEKELFELSPKSKDPLKNLVEGAKVAKKRADSPITLPLAHVFSTLGEVGKGAGDLLRKSLDGGGMAVELTYYRALNQLSEKPSDRLDRWAALLKNHDHRDAEDLERATKDAEWVRSPNSKANAEAKVKALYVLALVERNKRENGSFDKSRKLLSQVKKEAGDANMKADWLTDASSATRQLEEPKAYFLPQAMAKAQLGDMDGAMKVLELGLKANPNHPELRMARASLLFDQNKGGISALLGDQIRKDAAAAQADQSTAVRATLLLALLEEKLSNFSKAEQYYRQALKLPNQSNSEQNAIRLAWGAFLLRDRGEEPTPLPEPNPQPKAKPMPPKVKPVLPAPKPAPKTKPVVPAPKPAPKAKPFPPAPKPAPPKTSHLRIPQVFSFMSLALAQFQEVPNPKEDPNEAAKAEEAIKLAKEIIDSAKDDKTKGQGYMLLGRALFKQGRRNEGLKEFAKGMSMAFPGAGGDSLDAMLKDHPSFRRPDATNRANPTLAEKYFGQGLHLFWSKQFASAEDQFEKAVHYYRKDARYFYYLGLAQLYQNTVAKRKDSETSFEEGATLETESLPTSAEINSSLERIQGPIRQYLDRIRYGLAKNDGS